MDKLAEFYIGAVKMLNNLGTFWTLLYIKQNIMKQGTIKMLTKYISKLHVHGSVHHSTVHTENPTRCISVPKFIIPYLYEAQHVSGDTPPIIRSLKLH
jgi:hypothetical protein